MSPKEKENVNRRQELIEAFYQCIIDKGYGSTTFKDISRQSGHNHGLIHYYFQTKENLLVELAKWLADGLEQKFEQVDIKVKNPKEAIDICVGFCSEYLIFDRGFNLVFYDFFTIAFRNERIREILDGIYEKYREQIIKVIKYWVETKTIASVDAELIAQLMVSINEGLSVQWMINPADINEREAKQMLRDVLIVYLKPGEKSKK